MNFRNLLLCATTFVAAMSTFSCSKNNSGNDPETVQLPFLFNTNEIGNGDQEYEITGTYTLPKGTYVLKGWVYVTDGSQLTIEPGTVIKGDKDTKATLIVERGAKLIAKGSENAPIVFTSNMAPGNRKPGDWGGVIICGKAVNNNTEMIIEGGPRSKHGGNDNNDNSGILSYVRIEFAGYPFKTDQEINGLTMGSVGSATQIDHIQVSYSNDDSFEWFGGCVNAKYLIAYKGWDDDFDTDNGYSGNLQFLLGVRDSKIADQSLSNGFESDNEANGTNKQPITSPVFSNVTFVGPMAMDNAFENTTSYITAGNMNPQNGSKLGQFQAAIQIRRSSRLNCYNSVCIGYPVGLIIENDKGSQTQESATAGDLALKNLVFSSMTILGSDKNKSFKDLYTNNSSIAEGETRESFSASFFKNKDFNNTVASASEININYSNNSYAPNSGSILLNRNNLFTDAKLSGSFFEKVNYIGAFKSSSAADNWAANWTNFNPQQAAY